MGHDGKNAARITLTCTTEEKKELERLAAEMDVSLSWLVRQGAKMVLEAKTSGSPIGRISTDA